MHKITLTHPGRTFTRLLLACLALLPLVRHPLCAELAVKDGLCVWLKADEGAQADGVGRVSRWADCSGADNDAKANGPSCPILAEKILNGKPVVRFSGDNTGKNQFLFIKKSDLIHFKNLSIHAVMIFRAIPYGIGINYEGGYRFLAEDVGGGKVLSARFATASNAWNQTLAAGKIKLEADLPYLVGAIYNGTTFELYLNGELDGSRNASGNLLASEDGIYIGAVNQNFFALNADIAEIFIYNRALSTKERQTVENYLAKKYDISVDQAADAQPGGPE